MFVIFGEFMGSPYRVSKASVAGARLGILRRALSMLPIRHQTAIFYLVADQRAKARSIAREIRNLCYRIRVLFSERTWRVGPSIGPGWERDEAGCLRECIQTHACIEGIKELEKLYPWITSFDVTVFLHGWRGGAQWVLDNQDYDRRNNRRNEASPVPLSISNQEVLEQSKCDLSIPPPSQE